MIEHEQKYHEKRDFMLPIVEKRNISHANTHSCADFTLNVNVKQWQKRGKERRRKRRRERRGKE